MSTATSARRLTTTTTTCTVGDTVQECLPFSARASTCPPEEVDDLDEHSGLLLSTGTRPYICEDSCVNMATGELGTRLGDVHASHALAPAADTRSCCVLYRSAPVACVTESEKSAVKTESVAPLASLPERPLRVPQLPPLCTPSDVHMPLNLPRCLPPSPVMAGVVPHSGTGESSTTGMTSVVQNSISHAGNGVSTVLDGGSAHMSMNSRPSPFSTTLRGLQLVNYETPMSLPHTGNFITAVAEKAEGEKTSELQPAVVVHEVPARAVKPARMPVTAVYSRFERAVQAPVVAATAEQDAAAAAAMLAAAAFLSSGSY